MQADNSSNSRWWSPDRTAWMIWVIMVLAMVTGLCIVYLNQQNRGLTSDGRLVGRIESFQQPLASRHSDVTPVSNPFAAVRLILWRQNESKLNIESITTPSQSGVFAFLIRPEGNEIGLWVHVDSNGNQQFDPGELSWNDVVTDSIVAQQTSLQQTLTVSLTAQLESTQILDRLGEQRRHGVVDTASTTVVPVAFGEVVGMDDDRLAASTGPAGLWLPAASMKKTGLGVYFLEPFDAARKPLLLVHGAGGSAQDFSRFIQHVDRGWQVWLYHYPSGMRLDGAGQALARLLEGLHRRHGSLPVSIVAHSMGGLVARSSLAQLPSNTRQSIVSSLVTVATPWRGHPAAWYGVHHAPVVLPSWRDMLPRSTFLTELESAETGVPHMLIYGEKSRRKFYLPRRNDGTIGVESATHKVIADRAEAVVRFELGHGEIIRSADVSAVIMQYLNDG